MIPHLLTLSFDRGSPPLDATVTNLTRNIQATLVLTFCTFLSYLPYPSHPLSPSSPPATPRRIDDPASSFFPITHATLSVGSPNPLLSLTTNKPGSSINFYPHSHADHQLSVLSSSVLINSQVTLFLDSVLQTIHILTFPLCLDPSQTWLLG